MKRNATAFLLASWCASGAFAQAARAPALPPGAAALGYSKCVINEHPSVTDIAPGKNGDYAWFSGQWYAPEAPALDHYQMLISAVRAFVPPTSALPALPHDSSR